MNEKGVLENKSGNIFQAKESERLIAEFIIESLLLTEGERIKVNREKELNEYLNTQYVNYQTNMNSKFNYSKYNK